MTTETKSSCPPHIWHIQPPGEGSTGVCRGCGEVKVFEQAFRHGHWMEDRDRRMRSQHYDPKTELESLREQHLP
jgi:hypothetical protein